MFSILTFLLFLLAIPLNSHAEKIRITADNVNIRAASNLTSRVMGQVSRDAVLEALVLGDEWIGVSPPANVLGWIRANLVTNGVITASRVNVRSGPGINYQIIAGFTKGQTPKKHASFADWISVSLPDETLVWVYRKFTEPFTATLSSNEATSDKPADARTGIAAKPPGPADPKKPLPSLLHYEESERSQNELLKASGITSNMLAQTADQGLEVTRNGVLKKTSILWRRPSRFVLTEITEDGTQPVCYVTGNDSKLKQLLNRELTIEGRQYIIQGSKLPLLTVSRIKIK